MNPKQVVIKSVLEKTKSLYDKKECAIFLASDNRLTSNVDMVVSTGIIALDIVCAKAGSRQYGLPFGRQVEIFGNESIGKTTLLLQIAANTQRLGGVAYWIETEEGLDLSYAKKLGVNTKELILSQPDYAEQVFEEIETVVGVISDMKEKIPVTILWDSAAATQTKQEMEGDFGQSHMASFGRFISQAERKINPMLSKNKVLFCFTNQVRAKIGGYGSAITTYGEGTFKFYDSIKIQLTKEAQIIEKGVVLGNKVAFKILKNKCMNTAFVKIDGVDCVKGQGFLYESGLINALDIKHKIDRSKKGWLGLNLPSIGDRKFRETELADLIRTDENIKKECVNLLFKKKKKIIKESENE